MSAVSAYLSGCHIAYLYMCPISNDGCPRAYTPGGPSSSGFSSGLDFGSSIRTNDISFMCAIYCVSLLRVE